MFWNPYNIFKPSYFITFNDYMHIEDFLLLDFLCKNIFVKADSSRFIFKLEFLPNGLYLPTKQPWGGHLTVVDFTHLSPPLAEASLTSASPTPCVSASMSKSCTCYHRRSNVEVKKQEHLRSQVGGEGLL